MSARLDRLDELLRELDAIRDAGWDRYLSEFRTRLAAEHALQVAIQTCLDIGAHLIAELGLQPPAEYRSVFANLRAAGLEARLAERLTAAAGMRNILVHGYLDIDDEAVWDALGRVDDLRSFALAVREIVDREERAGRKTEVEADNQT